MVTIPAHAVSALAAAGVDIRHNALPDPGRVVSVEHLSDKLVTRHASKVHVAALELNIRVADASETRVDQGLPSSPFRLRVVVNNPGTILDDECSHGDGRLV